jgi:hypothetical protein
LALVGVMVALSSSAAAPPVPAQQTVREPGTGQPNSLFGETVAVQGKTLVVGAPRGGPGAPAGPGAVYVFNKTGGKFKRTATLTASDGENGDQLGTSVAIDGDTIVAGAPGQDDDNGADVGSLYTFARDGAATRHETAQLVSSAGANSKVGSSVAIDGDRTVVGGPGSGAGEGFALVYTTTGAPDRQPYSYLFPPNNAGDGASLGASVAIDGDTIVVGAPHSTANPDGSGAVFTYARDHAPGTSFLFPTGTLEVNAFGGLGTAVAIDGSTIAASALNAGVNGAVFTFSTSGNSVRGPEDELTPKLPAKANLFGSSVAMDQDRIVVGARGAGKNEGAIFQFARHGAANRHEKVRLQAEPSERLAQLGTSVAVDRDTLIAGAPSPGTASGIGSATVFFPDRVAPKTVGLSGPEEVAQGSKAKFRFHSNEKGSTFKCRLDNQKSVGCRSPDEFRVKGLEPGKHAFSVDAIDPAGNKDKTPAKTSFRVKP